MNVCYSLLYPFFKIFLTDLMSRKYLVKLRQMRVFMCVCVYMYTYPPLCMNTQNTEYYLFKLYVYVYVHTHVYMHIQILPVLYNHLTIKQALLLFLFNFIGAFFSIPSLWLFCIRGLRISLSISFEHHPLGILIGICDVTVALADPNLFLFPLLCDLSYYIFLIDYLLILIGALYLGAL